MRSNVSLFPLAAGVALAFASVAAVFIAPDLARAADPAAQSQPPSAATPPSATPAPADEEQSSCTCPADRLTPEAKEKIWPRPKFAGLTPTALDQNDEIAALESVQLALSEVGDGSTYVWHRYHGRLSGVVQPTTSFRDASGNVCRHLVVILSSGTRSRRSEGIACRLGSGQWQLQG